MCETRRVRCSSCSSTITRSGAFRLAHFSGEIHSLFPSLPFFPFALSEHHSSSGTLPSDFQFANFSNRRETRHNEERTTRISNSAPLPRCNEQCSLISGRNFSNTGKNYSLSYHSVNTRSIRSSLINLRAPSPKIGRSSHRSTSVHSTFAASALLGCVSHSLVMSVSRLATILDFSFNDLEKYQKFTPKLWNVSFVVYQSNAVHCSSFLTP